jgi:aminoglycoside phosphotransferase (APT) family kinase protein
MNPSPTAPNPRETEAALSAVLREVHGPDARLEDWTVSPAFKRGKGRTRCYGFAFRAGSSQLRHHRWVGKFYERDDVARRDAWLLDRLAESDCGPRRRFVVPRVVGYYEPSRLLFLTHEGGESVVAAITQDPGWTLSAMGRALAALHAAPVAPDTITSTEGLLARLRQEIGDLAARFPDETPSLFRILIELERQAPSEPSPPRLLHGALGPAQLLWRRGDVVFLDFDGWTGGDPALDLGSLLAQLRRLTLRKPAKIPDFASLRRGILDAYESASPHDPGLDRRVEWYERVRLVRKLHYLALDGALDGARQTEANATPRRHAEAIRLLHELPLLVKGHDGRATSKTANAIA